MKYSIDFKLQGEFKQKDDRNSGKDQGYDQGYDQEEKDNNKYHMMKSLSVILILIITLTFLITNLILPRNFKSIDSNPFSDSSSIFSGTSNIDNPVNLDCPNVFTFNNNNDNSKDDSSNSYQLVWYDEFRKDGLPDSTKWGYEIGNFGWGNKEMQYYTNRSQNARVENGHLIIEARKEIEGDSNYTSARLTTVYKGDWTYGRFYIRAKLPNAHGGGLLPALWFLPTDWQGRYWPDIGEIDMMEQVSANPQQIHSSIHTHTNNWHGQDQISHSIFYIPDADTEFHIYALEWTPDAITFSIDSNPFFKYSNDRKGWMTWPFTHDFHLIMNIAVGGIWGGINGVDDSLFPAHMTIDYVHVCRSSNYHSS